jgi:hypothetical protein
MNLTELLAAIKSIDPFIEWVREIPFVRTSKLGPALDWLSTFAADPQGSIDRLKSTDLGQTIVVALRFTIPYLKAYAATTENTIDDRLVSYLEQLVAAPKMAMLPGA